MSPTDQSRGAVLATGAARCGRFDRQRVRRAQRRGRTCGGQVCGAPWFFRCRCLRERERWGGGRAGPGYGPAERRPQAGSRRALNVREGARCWQHDGAEGASKGLTGGSGPALVAQSNEAKRAASAGLAAPEHVLGRGGRRGRAWRAGAAGGPGRSAVHGSQHD
ncbi:MAG: hypothetical protein J3K34DRAFT_42752 [Monoraphidium minutum]|nr:MAG: hypothetical protein J3K34DRAFT_42752 [Monoraphidium minutum]